MDKRNDKIKAEQDMMIDMDPEIAEIFKASQSVSGKYQYSIHFSLNPLYLTLPVLDNYSIQG